MSTDRIETRIEVKATRARVWRALADAKEFGAWFGMQLDGPFAVGKTVKGRLTVKGHEGVTLELQVVRMESARAFAYRWHPYAIDPKVDYTKEPTTLVEFQLEDIADGTVVVIVESGFDQIPLSRRMEAFRMNQAGWASQVKNLVRYVTQP